MRWWEFQTWIFSACVELGMAPLRIMVCANTSHRIGRVNKASETWDLQSLNFRPRGSTQSLKKSHNNKLNNMMFEKCLLTGLHSPENNWASGWTCCLQGKWWLTRHWKRASEINGPLLLHWKGLIVNSTVPGIHSKVPHSSLYFSSVSNTKSIKYRLKVLLFPKQFHVIHALDPSYKVGFN